MADFAKKRGRQDGERIDANEPHELGDWTNAPDVTPDRLTAAVQKAGVMAADVQRELGK